MKYPIFLSDFDGTLVRADGTVSEANRRAIETYRKAGGVFAIVTGRMLVSILPRLKELGLSDGLAVAYQGAVIADVRTGEILKCGGFSAEAALRPIRYFESCGYHIHVYTGDDFYSNMDDEYLRAYEDICCVKGKIEPRLSDMVAARSVNVIKVLAMVDLSDRDRVKAETERFLGEEYFVTCSSPYLVEVMPKGENKAGAVDFLSAYYGVPRGKIAAIGDQPNDLPMLERAGGKFAVSNAEQALKERATVVASCEEDGVAEALLKYALGE